MKRALIFALFCFVLAIGINAQSYKEFFLKALKYEEADSLLLAEECYKQALKKDPTNAHNGMVFANLGSVQRRMKHLNDAFESYNYALNLLPVSIPILMERASLALEIGDFDKAYIDCCTILDIDKKNVKALLFRAYLLYSKGDYLESLNDYKRLLEIEPQNIPARMGLVTLYQRDKKYKQALELVNNLVIESPANAELYILRAGVEKDLNYNDLSLGDLDKAIELSPKYANAYLLRGEILLTMNKKERARVDFEKAIELGIPHSDLVEKLKSCK